MTLPTSATGAENHIWLQVQTKMFSRLNPFFVQDIFQQGRHKYPLLAVQWPSYGSLGRYCQQHLQCLLVAVCSMQNGMPYWLSKCKHNSRIVRRSNNGMQHFAKLKSRALDNCFMQWWLISKPCASYSQLWCIQGLAGIGSIFCPTWRWCLEPCENAKL